MILLIAQESLQRQRCDTVCATTYETREGSTIINKEHHIKMFLATQEIYRSLHCCKNLQLKDNSLFVTCSERGESLRPQPF